MTFKFRLQRILELREQAEQAKARALVSAQDAAEDARRAHDTLTDLRAVSSGRDFCGAQHRATSGSSAATRTGAAVTR